jgi:hypothetical protein
LSTPTADVNSLRDVLVNACGYSEDRVILIKDGQARKPVINEKLQWLARHAEPRDTIFIFFSGHGIRPADGFDAEKEYLCLVDTDFYNLSATAISGEEFTTALQAISSERIVVFLDACHAGGVGIPNDDARRFKPGFSSEVYDRLMGEVGEGRVIIASCKPGEKSWELEDKDNGLFTHHLLMGLGGEGTRVQGGMVHIFDLFDYLSTSVRETCETRGLDIQTPLFKAYDVTANFPITLVVDVDQEVAQRKLSPEALQKLPRFQDLVTLVRRGKAIPVIGPGVSEEVEMPTKAELIHSLENYANDQGIEISDNTFDNIVAALERDVGPVCPANEIQHCWARSIRRQGRHYRPYLKGAYRLIPAIRHFDTALVTTNWDDFLSQALDNSNTILQELHIVPNNNATPPVVKLCGSFNNLNDMLVANVTAQDMLQQIKQGGMQALWKEITDPVNGYSFIFIGYNDWTDQVFESVLDLTQCREQLAADHFFVAPLTPDEENAIWVQVGAHPIPTTAANFMLALFRELGEFTDRQAEREFVKVERLQFIEFYGDFGSGKTELLDYCAKQAEAEGWSPEQVLRLTLTNDREESSKFMIVSEDPSASQLLESLRDLREHLIRTGRIFLIIDDTERIEDKVIANILKEVVPVIQDLNRQNERSKLLIAGRRSVKGWPNVAYRYLYSHELSPLTQETAHEMAVKFLLAAEPDSHETFTLELIRDILEVSSGHPRFVKMILTDLTDPTGRQSNHITLPTSLTTQEKSAYIERFNDDIDHHVYWGDDPKIKEVYEDKLCVFRRLNREILGKLDLSVDDPLPSLLNLHLLSDECCSINSVIRHTKAQKLRYKDTDAYENTHKAAQIIFYDGMKKLADRVQREYMLEWLFHTARLLMVKTPDNIDHRCNEFLSRIQPIKFRVRRDPLSRNIKVNFVDHITQDFELWNLLVDCIGQECLEDIKDIFRDKEIIDV